MMALTCYIIEIRKAKWSSWRDLGIEDAPDEARLMRIMASPSASRVGSVRLPDAGTAKPLSI